MDIIESIGTAAFLIAFAFVVLGLIFLIINLFSYVINKFFSTENEKKSNAGQDSAVYAETPFVNQAVPHSSELTLTDTDEQTAAMIMAIVSDESGIPLPELHFKSIKLLTKENN